MGQNGGCLDQRGKRCMGYRGDRGTPVGFAVRLLHHINRTWPAAHRINNAALDGTDDLERTLRDLEYYVISGADVPPETPRRRWWQRGRSASS